MDCLEHFSHLSLFSFMNNYFHHGLILMSFEHPDCCRSGFNALDLYALLQELEFCGGGRTHDCGFVGFIDLKSRVKNSIAQFPIVGHEQCSLGFKVEATNGKESQRDMGDKVGNHGAALGICQGGDIAGGLVQEDIDLIF